jgi:hypothetical protein
MVAVLVISAIAAVFVSNGFFGAREDKPFYVGVTYSGDNPAEAKLLVDKVKNYTNLFVLQSGPLMGNVTVVNEIGDYAVANGLYFAAYVSALYSPQGAMWVGNAQQRWGDMFAGVYYGDEPGGQMLDSLVDLTAISRNFQGNGSDSVNSIWQGTSSNDRMTKNQDGSVSRGDTSYSPDGEVMVAKSNYSWPDSSFWESSNRNAVFENNQTSKTTTYYPNGSICIQESYYLYNYHPKSDPELKDSGNIFFTMKNGSDRIAQEESYQQVKSRNPIPDYNAAADIFVNRTGSKIDALSSLWLLSNKSFPIFTADYGLYWWDYQSGYDMVLAELGWNNSVAQEIGLVRGAADLQGKDWGTIITWKYNQAPYLPGGDEMFEEMKASYECGASYVVVFNYAEGVSDSFGTLKDEHFGAIERFWNEVVQNPDVVHGGVKANAVLVLPHDLGWGMRNQRISNDKIWGIWSQNDTSQQVWTQMQSKLAQYGSKLDIVYEDSAYPVAWKYPQVYYWNQTG